MTKNERNITLSIKVSEDEREVLQTRAKNLKMNVSEFIRMATLSGSEESISIIAENARLNEKIRQLESKKSLTGTFVQDETAIVIPCTQEQKEVVLKLYGNCYEDGRAASVQILNFLVEDAITPHWYFAGSQLCAGRDYPSHYTEPEHSFLPLNAQRRSYAAQISNIKLDAIREVFKDFVLHTTPEDAEVLNDL